MDDNLTLSDNENPIAVSLVPLGDPYFDIYNENEHEKLETPVAKAPTEERNLNDTVCSENVTLINLPPQLQHDEIITSLDKISNLSTTSKHYILSRLYILYEFPPYCDKILGVLFNRMPRSLNYFMTLLRENTPTAFKPKLFNRLEKYVTFIINLMQMTVLSPDFDAAKLTEDVWLSETQKNLVIKLITKRKPDFPTHWCMLISHKLRISINSVYNIRRKIADYGDKTIDETDKIANSVANHIIEKMTSNEKVEEDRTKQPNMKTRVEKADFGTLETEICDEGKARVVRFVHRTCMHKHGRHSIYNKLWNNKIAEYLRVPATFVRDKKKFDLSKDINCTDDEMKVANHILQCIKVASINRKGDPKKAHTKQMRDLKDLILQELKENGIITREKTKEWQAKYNYPYLRVMQGAYSVYKAINEKTIPGLSFKMVKDDILNRWVKVPLANNAK